MPIVNDDPQAPAGPVHKVEIAAPETVVVDTRYVPTASLLTNIEGSSWTVNYFSQVLTGDAAVQGQQPTLDPLYQSYRLIKDFELKVSQPLSNTQDQQTMTMKVTGAANVYPFLIPNVGDMFIADVGDGREGLFKITMSERRSIFRDTCYTVDYELVSFADADRFGDLYSKVVLTLQFVKDYLQHGQNPLLALDTFERVQRLSDRYHEMVENYFHSFVSRKFKTLCLPGQELPTYDHFLVQEMPKWFSTWDAAQLRELRVLNVDDDPAMRSLTLWQLLTRKEPQRLSQLSKQWGLVSARCFERNPMLEGIYWTGVEKVLYPLDPTATLDQEQTVVPKPLLDETLVLLEEPLLELQTLLGPALGVDNDPWPESVLIHPVMTTDSYVFSPAFYARATTGQSKLELAVWQYLQNQAIDHQLLLQFTETYHVWGPLERFYYVPIVALLIKASVRSL
jgi:hypothetical protein